MCADFDAQLPVRSTATEFTTEVANASGTTINPSEDYSQGSTTSGQNGVLAQGATTTSAPTYSTGTTNPLSLDTSGNLRVTVSGGAGTQNVNITEVAGNSVSTAASGIMKVGISDSSGNSLNSTSGSLDVSVTNSTLAVTQSTSPWVVSGTVTADQGGSWTISATQGTSPWVDNLTEVGGSSISLGQTTMSASLPVVIASNQTPINVQIGGVTPVVTYNTTSALASNSSTSFTLSGPVNLDAVHATASGQIEVVIAIGVSGSEATNWAGFTSAAEKNFDWNLKDPISIASGSDCKVTITNRDLQAMNVYQSFINH